MTDPSQAPDAQPSSAQPKHRQLKLENFLPYRLSVLSNRTSNAIAREYSERFDMTIPEWRVMAVLGRYPGLSAREVTERTAMDKVAVSRAVARLLERELLRRETHGDDRRRSVLTLTEAGHSVYDEVAPMTLACEQQLLSTLDADDRAQLEALLDKLGNGVGLMVGHD